MDLWIKNWKFYVLLLTSLTDFGASQHPDDAYRYNNLGMVTPPRIVNKGQRLKVRMGDTIKLPCDILNKGRATVLWMKEMSHISVGNLQVKKGLRISLVDGTSLLIKNANRDYAGNYTCQVEWSSNNDPISVTHQLEVLVEASILYVRPISPKDRTLALDRAQDELDLTQEGIVDAREGQNVTFECKGDGIPRPDIEWISDVWPAERSKRGRFLNLTRVSKKSGGMYTCIANNRVGHPASQRITLRVHCS